MTTDQALREFGAGSQSYHGLTRAYARRQQNELRAIATAAGVELLDLEADQLRGYLASQIDSGLKASAVGQKLVNIRPFFTWAFERKLIDAERYLALRGVRAPRNGNNRNPRPYSAKERAAFWRDFDTRFPWVRDVYATRSQHRGQNTEERGKMFFDRWLEGRSGFARARPYCARLQAEAIVSLAMIGGLRRIEVYNLCLDDLDPDNEYVVVQGARKGDGREKERAVPWLTQGMRDSVDRWLQTRERLIARDASETHDRPWLYLYINGSGRPGDHMRFGPFDETMRTIGRWQWHRMRHTAITEMLRAGYRIQTVSEIAGHTDISMTMRYAKLLREDIVHQARINRERYERQMGRGE